jgi:MoxR-like ATPase
MQEKLSHIEKTEDAKYKEYMGVKLPIAEKRDTAPKVEAFKDYVEDAFSRDVERTIATSWALSEPVLIEGGTSLGKTTAVKKMCAELGYEVHYQNLNNHTDPADLMGKYTPNPHQKDESDPKYIFADGSVTKALRVEKGKIKVLILDEYNSAHPGVIIRLHEVLDAYKRSGTVTLTEDGNEVLEVDAQTLKIIALTNPAGGGFADREPLDPAQIRRWSYHKLADKVPQGTFKAGVLALSGLGGTETAVDTTKEKFTRSSDAPFPQERLKEIPGMPEIVTQYIAFHEASQKMIEEKKIANNQRQKFSFDDREEPRRVFAYISRFYTGDIAEVTREALRYFYAGKVLDPRDKALLEEMIKKVDYKPVDNPERQGLGSFATVPETAQSTGPKNKKEFGNKLREALRILGSNVRGPRDFIADTSARLRISAFTLDAIDLPVISYDTEDLEGIKAEGDYLSLYTTLSDQAFIEAVEQGSLKTEDFVWNTSHSQKL